MSSDGLAAVVPPSSADIISPFHNPPICLSLDSQAESFHSESCRTGQDPDDLSSEKGQRPRLTSALCPGIFRMLEVQRSALLRVHHRVLVRSGSRMSSRGSDGRPTYLR